MKRILLDAEAGAVTAHRLDETGQPLCGMRVARHRPLVVAIESGTIPADWFCVRCRDALANMADAWIGEQRPVLIRPVAENRNGRIIFEKRLL